MTSTSISATHAETAVQTNMLEQPIAGADGVRELSLDEIEGVSGGVLDPLSIVVGGAVVLVGYAIGWLLFSKGAEPAKPAGGAAK